MKKKIEEKKQKQKLKTKIKKIAIGKSLNELSAVKLLILKIVWICQWKLNFSLSLSRSEIHISIFRLYAKCRSVNNFSIFFFLSINLLLICAARYTIVFADWRLLLCARVHVISIQFSVGFIFYHKNFPRRATISSPHTVDNSFADVVLFLFCFFFYSLFLSVSFRGNNNLWFCTVRSSNTNK